MEFTIYMYHENIIIPMISVKPRNTFLKINRVHKSRKKGQVCHGLYFWGHLR